MNTEKKETRIPYLDGIRGVAILMVWIDHFFHEYYFCQFGWIGVNLFFLLSGYFITGRLFYHAEKGKGYFRNFYVRRILRIFPLYYGCLFIFFIVLPHFYPKYDEFFSELYRSQGWYWLYMENWWLVLYGLPVNRILITLWSLAVEEQFYLVWPFLFRYVRLCNRKMIIGILWSLSVLVRVLTKDPNFIYFNTLTACEPLLMGALICILEREGRLERYRRLGAIGALLAIIGLVIVFDVNPVLTGDNAELMRFGYTCIDWIFAFFLYYTLLPTARAAILRKTFEAKWLRWCGKYSYGIYIFHWMILQFFVLKCQRVLIGRGDNPNLVYFLTRAGGVIAVLAVSYCSYRFYERKFLNLKRYFA